MDKKIPKEVTIGILESIIDETADFKPFGSVSSMKTLEIEGFEVNFSDKSYVDALKRGMESRVSYIESLKEAKGGKDELPAEAVISIKKIIDELK